MHKNVSEDLNELGKDTAKEAYKLYDLLKEFIEKLDALWKKAKMDLESPFIDSGSDLPLEFIHGLRKLYEEYGQEIKYAAQNDNLFHLDLLWDFSESLKKKLNNIDRYDDLGDFVKLAHGKLDELELELLRFKTGRYDKKTYNADAKYYVTVYEKDATYEPAEGGYQVETTRENYRKMFNTLEEAKQYASKLAKSDAEDYKLYQSEDGMHYNLSSKWGDVGEGKEIYVETENEVGSNEKPYYGYC